MPNRKARPLKWRLYHVQDNGWYGLAGNGMTVCYVYQPIDNRIRRGPMPWQVHSYIDGLDNPVQGKGRFGKFTSSRSAKLAAQAWWRKQVAKM